MRSTNAMTRRIQIVGWSIALMLVAVIGNAQDGGKQPKKRVAVVGFKNEADYFRNQEWGNIGGGLSEKLVDALIETGKFVILERQAFADILAEHNLGHLGDVEPTVAGRLTSAQALIRGVITNVDGINAQKGGLRLGGIKIGGKNQKVTVGINIRIIDTITGQILESKTVEGSAKMRGFSIQQGSDEGFTMNNSHPIGKAVKDAIDQAVVEIAAGMEKIPWQGSISRVSGRQIIVNAGYQENVETGLTLRVFERGAEIIDKDTNESLGHLDEEIGIVRIVRVEPRFSIAEIIEGRGFAAGNIVRPVSSSI